jgi:hypothetical protein
MHYKLKSLHPVNFKKGGMVITRRGIHYLNERKRSESPKMKSLDMKFKNMNLVDGRGFKPIKPLKFK